MSTAKHCQVSREVPQLIIKLKLFSRSQRVAQGQHQQSHSSGVVVQLQAKLASMSNNFKQVLEVRTENLKSQKSRAEQFSVGGVSTSLPQAVTPSA